MSSPPDLSRHVQVDVSSARVARVWQSIAPRLEQPRSRLSRWVAPLALAGTLATGGIVAAVAFERAPEPASVWENAALETKGDSLSVRLEDSSRIELAADSRVELAESTPDAVRLRLRRGSVRCDVTRHDNRRFLVEALGVEVRVVGTLFSVAIGEGERQVDVAVERGSVEVRARGEAGTYRKIGAGERWSVALADAVPDASAAPASTAPAAPAVPPSQDDAATAPEPAPAPADVRPQLDDEPASARELLDLANLARRSGDVAAAARAYELLLARYPNDPRVGLAAFELGRLRLERLGNPSGAVAALERAVARAPSRGLREDALARLVQAHAAAGDTARCRRARERYLSEYPDGVHTHSVKSRCGDR